MFFGKIRVKIKFRDTKNKKKKIGAFTNIRIEDEKIKIFSRRLILERNKVENILKERELPTFTEESMNQILDIAKTLKVPWGYLFNFEIKFENIDSTKYVQRIGAQGSKNLLIKLTNGIELEFERKKYVTKTPSKRLIEIENLIQEYQWLHGKGEIPKEIAAKREVIEWLELLKKSNSYESNLYIINKLGEIGDDKAIPFVGKFLSSDSNSIRVAAEEAVKSIKDRHKMNSNGYIPKYIYGGEMTRINRTEQIIKKQMDELKSIPPEATEGNTCPFCSTDLNLAKQINLIKYMDCPNCEISILLRNVLEGNICPNCLNSLAEVEIIKLKLIICPKCKKLVKG